MSIKSKLRKLVGVGGKRHRRRGGASRRRMPARNARGRFVKRGRR